MEIRACLDRDQETGIAYLSFISPDDRRAGQSVNQETVSLTDGEFESDLDLDFDEARRLLGIEFLDEAYLPPGV